MRGNQNQKVLTNQLINIHILEQRWRKTDFQHQEKVLLEDPTLGGEGMSFPFDLYKNIENAPIV